MALDRTWYNTLVDDDGSNAVGSPWEKADVDSLLDAIDALPAANSTFTAHGVVVGNGAGALATTAAGSAGQVLTSNGASADPTFQAAAGGAVDPGVCQGRLTLTSGLAVTTADVTAATSIYFTPYKGNRISLYDGASAWVNLAFTEKTLALGTLTNALPYDVFAYSNAGVVALELLAWTNTTTRATALVLQDGVLVKTGATTRRYLGTFLTTSTTTSEDSVAKRFVWNYYNRVPRVLRRVDDTNSWTYSTGTWRQANAAAANQLALVVGVAEAALRVSLFVLTHNNTAGQSARVGIGVDSTTVPATFSTLGALTIPVAAYTVGLQSVFVSVPPIGAHVYVWLEQASGGTQTWQGDAGDATGTQSGMEGLIDG